MTEQPQPQRLRVGEGKISGYLSIFLAVISLGAVICFHFPEYFTTPEFRAVYPVEVLRWMLLACLVLAFGFAFTSFLLSGKTKLGLAGVPRCRAYLTECPLSAVPKRPLVLPNPGGQRRIRTFGLRQRPRSPAVNRT